MKHTDDAKARKVPINPEGNEVEETGEKPGESEMELDVAAVQEELDKLRADVEETQDRYLRTLADFDNFRRRQREDTARQVGIAREDILIKLLPIIDNFERTLQAAEAQHTYESLVEGVGLIMKQMRELLDKEGVEPIEAVGQEFNPEIHECMMRSPAEGCEDSTILDEFEKGYTINGKVLRPSRVRVAMSE